MLKQGGRGDEVVYLVYGALAFALLSLAAIGVFAALIAGRTFKLEEPNNEINLEQR